MATAATFFIGNDSDAQLNDGLQGGSNDHKAEFYKVMPTDIEGLYEAATGRQAPELEVVASTEDYDVVTFKLADQIIAWLNTLTDTDVPQTISAWKKSEDCPYDNEQDLNDLLKTLIRLSKLGTENSKSFFITIET